MKYLKVLGSATVAVMALMAFLGAGSASAAGALCKTTSEGSCPGGEYYPAGTVINMSLEESTSWEFWFVNSGGEETGTEPFVKCSKSTLEAEAKEFGGEHDVLKTLTSEGCNQSTSAIALGELQVIATGGGNGQFISKGLSIKVTSLLFGTCVYGSSVETNIGKITGGTMATVDISVNLPKEKEGSGCPNTTRWTAKYTVTSPEPLYATL